MTDQTAPQLGEIVTPIPANAPPLPKHHKLGSHTQKWTYKNADGLPVAHILRFDLPTEVGDGKPKKTILPLTLRRAAGAQLKWEWKSLTAPRPLYNLDHIVSSEKPDRIILITEGEKAADAAAQLFPEMVATTPMNGAQATAQTDWSPCAGRHCIIAPDLDDPGVKFAEKVRERLQAVGAASIRHLDLSVIAAVRWQDSGEVLRAAEDIKVGYDLADTLADGWTASLLQTALQQTPDLLKDIGGLPEVDVSDACDAEATYGGMPGWRFEVDEQGVWKLEERINPKTMSIQVLRQYVCSPVKIVGFARDSDGGDWGRVVDITDPDGRVRRILIPAKDFAGHGTDVFKRLMSAGLQFNPNRVGKDRLLEYVLGSAPQRRLTHTRQPGWVGNTFGLPDGSFGPDELICDLGNTTHRYKMRGNYKKWQSMAGLGVGNSRFAFALSAAFAGPLIHPLGQEGGGIHLVGSMAAGKTTLAKVAGSVWGGDYVLGWSGTESGHEAIAAQANDTLLVLDEIGRADPALLGMILYQQTNGVGKNRSDVDSNPKDMKRFTNMVISTGEITVSEAIAASPRGGRVMAGQLVRLLDIPADVNEKLGVFENLHNFEDSRAFATHLESVLQQHHGHAARDFLERLTFDQPAATDAVKGMISEFLKTACPPQASRQVQRAAARFALIAGAGELAASFGVLPWPQGEALSAAQACFSAWLATQSGTSFTQEKVEAIRTVQRFISLHGQARFEALDSDPSTEIYPRIIANRAGYCRSVEHGVEFSVLPEIWRSEVCKGRNAEQIAKYLAETDLLVLGEPGRLTKKMRVPDQPKPIRCYVIKPEILAWSGAPEAEQIDDRVV